MTTQIIDLKAFRKAHELKQRDIATTIDVDRTRISKYESGKATSRSLTKSILAAYPAAEEFLVDELPMDPVLEEAIKAKEDEISHLREMNKNLLQLIGDSIQVNKAPVRLEESNDSHAELLKFIRDYTSEGISQEETALLTVPSRLTEVNYDQLLSRLSMGVEGGKGLQQARAQIHRRYLAFNIMKLFGFSKTAVPLAHKLVQQAVKYQQHHIATELCRFLSKHYAIYIGKMSIAEDFHSKADMYNIIYTRELHFDWSFQKIRSRLNTNAFHNCSAEIERVLAEIEPYYKDSIRLMFIHYELHFFLSYISKDIAAQKENCIAAIKAFTELPFCHNFTINIFSFHLIDILIRTEDLATAELVILNRIADLQDIGKNEFRFNSLLLEVYIKKGDTVEARALLDNLLKKPKFKFYEKKMEELEAALVKLEALEKKKVVSKKKSKQG